VTRAATPAGVSPQRGAARGDAGPPGPQLPPGVRPFGAGNAGIINHSNEESPCVQGQRSKTVQYLVCAGVDDVFSGGDGARVLRQAAETGLIRSMGVSFTVHSHVPCVVQLYW
jgi:hypothetical protein